MERIEKIRRLRDNIEAMDQIHQVNILAILKEHNVDHTENVNGVFVNMTLLAPAVISQMVEYLGYVKLQQTQLAQGENLKQKYRNEFYKDTKGGASCRTKSYV